ncbi:FAD-dependent oxidoreductase [uncultured Parabacteroides sp.]|uniref:FAD-dependent oxidoreductase n=2 Tax=uncultured Parabacteroides sp. TaxID=512312 RepID=UPI0025FC00CC|nr:FAD-dependent oxidoreductase [uncultured Parabacteroides sp.]
MIGRRDFVKKAGVMAMAVAVPDIVSSKTLIPYGQSLTLKLPEIKVDDQWDVIIVGGGPAGCTAAIAAAREGAKTLLIEAMGQLGGMGTAGMVPAWCPFSDGEKIIYKGLAEKIFRESKKGVPHEPENKLDWVSINPEYLISIYDRIVTESGAKVLFFSRLAAVEMSSDDTIDAIIVSNKAGLVAFKGKVYIDATGDGDLAAWSGASFKRGYDEKGSVQMSSLCFSFANIDSYDYINGPTLYVWKDESTPLYKAVRSEKYPLVDTHFCNNLVGPDVIQCNAGHMTVDTTDPWAISDAMILGRQKAVQYLEAMKDVRPSTFSNAFVVKTASLLGVRDSRRIEGDYIFTVEDWRQRKSFEDEIGRNCYYIDVHSGKHKPEHYKKGESHGIPYRCLTPKGIKNLLTAGRCISTDEQAFGSIRVMPCCLVTGEAAGMAAVHAIEQTRNDVHKIDISYLRKRLKEEGQLIL